MRQGKRRRIIILQVTFLILLVVVGTLVAGEIKFNSSFEMLFRINLHKFIFGMEKDIVYFDPSSLMENSLYIVERYLYRTIFEFSI